MLVSKASSLQHPAEGLGRMRLPPASSPQSYHAGMRWPIALSSRLTVIPTALSSRRLSPPDFPSSSVTPRGTSPAAYRMASRDTCSRSAQPVTSKSGWSGSLSRLRFAPPPN